jgi:hypothetical protein
LLGGAATPLVMTVPLVAWSRVHLQRHTLAQTAAGALLGTIILVVAWFARDLIA